uniref:Bifunctional inhibitor/plant lipid transfer protein/seed storage helical domain-containing protein n=1 Tax=Oryza brachyantha TaxID=4533 RepID=J3N972_ORYBR
NRSIDSISTAMARSSSPLLLVLAVLAAAAAAATGAEYCRDSLSGLRACEDFMFRGARDASPECCAAYSGAFDADPFCLCYIANGVYGRSTGYDVNVTHALEIPVNCGLVAPPPAAKPTAQSPVAAPSLPQAPMPSSQPSFTSPPPMPSSQPSFTSPSPMPSQLPPTSHGAAGAAVGSCIVAFAVAISLLALIS